MSAGGTRAGINGTILKGLAVPLPPEQRALLHAVQQSLADAAGFGNHVTDALSPLALLDQSILTRAFRGDLVPQDLDDEPADVLLERARAERQVASRDGGPGTRRSKRSCEAQDARRSVKGATVPSSTIDNRSTLHALLGALKREALHNIVDSEGVELADRRSTDVARAALANCGVTLESALEHLDRDELKAVCRALGHDDRGKTKDELRSRILSR